MNNQPDKTIELSKPLEPDHSPRTLLDEPSDTNNKTLPQNYQPLKLDD